MKKLKKLLIPLLLALTPLAACNRTANETPPAGPQAKSPSTPPSVNQPSSSALPTPNAPSGTTANQANPEPPSKELSKQEESSGMPRPGAGGSDHSTPAREPGKPSTSNPG